MLEEPEIITLDIDDGTSLDCEVLATFPFEDTEYIALLPDGEENDVYFYEHVEVAPREYELADIDDDDVFDRVTAEFDRLVEEGVAEYQKGED